MAPGHPAHMPTESFQGKVAEQGFQAQSARYGLGEGTLPLRQALIEEMQEVYCDAVIDPEEVVITSGANQALYVAMQTLACQGDEIILTIPYFFNHQMALEQLGIRPVYLITSAEDHFVPNPVKLEPLITSRTRAICLCSPSNPTGTAIPARTLAAIAKIAAKYKIALILDETYRDLLPRGSESSTRPHSLFSQSALSGVGANWQDYLVHVYSFSKHMAIPGYRLGALVASRQLVEQVLKIIDTQTICPSQIIQPVVAWSLRDANSRKWREEQRESIERRLDLFSRTMNELDGWQVTSKGAYYAFVRHPFTGKTSPEVVKAMITQCGVSALPASFFVPNSAQHSTAKDIGDNWMRFSIPNANEQQVAEIARRLSKLRL